jgi:hypothetical protein
VTLLKIDRSCKGNLNIYPRIWIKNSMRLLGTMKMISAMLLNLKCTMS